MTVLALSRIVERILFWLFDCWGWNFVVWSPWAPYVWNSFRRKCFILILRIIWIIYIDNRHSLFPYWTAAVLWCLVSSFLLHERLSCFHRARWMHLKKFRLRHCFPWISYYFRALSYIVSIFATFLVKQLQSFVSSLSVWLPSDPLIDFWFRHIDTLRSSPSRIKIFGIIAFSFKKAR